MTGLLVAVLLTGALALLQDSPMFTARDAELAPVLPAWVALVSLFLLRREWSHRGIA